MKRVFLIVLDSFGIGQMPDSASFGDINVNTNMSLHSGLTNVKHGKICITGVNGYNTRSMRDLQNYGNITIGNTSSDISIAGNGVHIAGLVTAASGSLGVTNLTKNINKGNITINRAKLNGRAIKADNSFAVSIGGLGAYYTGSSFANSENEGDITLSQYIAAGDVYLYLGGNIAHTTNEKLVVKGCKNIGTITVSDKITKAERVVKSSPKWEAGEHNGQKVKVKMVIPFAFAKEK